MPLVRTGSVDFGLSAQIEEIGPDLLVIVTGGPLPHIGAVAAATPRKSLADPAKTSASTSVFCYVGHKEDEIARFLAQNLAARLKRKVLVTAGMHWENLTPEGISQVEAQTGELLTAILNSLT
ncbi:proteasome assembly chaperone 4 family protein [Dethiosulfatarculus sandiegensis]|nr:proteasome assembly chaperone 4 family protein [Dethiosulfatarculus sandiegensis]